MKVILCLSGIITEREKEFFLLKIITNKMQNRLRSYGAYFQTDEQRRAELLTSQETQRSSSAVKQSLTVLWMGLHSRLRRRFWDPKSKLVMNPFVLCLQKKEAFVHCVHLHHSCIMPCLRFFLGFLGTFYFLTSHKLDFCDFLAPIWSIRDRSQLETGQATLVLLLKYKSLKCLLDVPRKLYIPAVGCGVAKEFSTKSDWWGLSSAIYLSL